MHAFKLMCCIEYSLGQGFIHTMSNGVKIDYLLEQGNFFLIKSLKHGGTKLSYGCLIISNKHF